VRTLDDVLREIKDEMLCYCVMVDYGSQDMGLDDTGENDGDRQIRIIAAPAGFLGGLRVCFQGSLSYVREMDIWAMPKKMPNPPTNGELMTKDYRWRRGVFMWGSDDAVRDWPARRLERKAAK
jgi:hypothetical protein